ncbi:MAG: PIN domain-containing protein [Ilumatobacteraceae bacterium]
MTATATTPDSSVVIAALSPWHPDHSAARRSVITRPRAISHVLLETFSVLTRLPSPHRVAPAIAAEALEAAFGGVPLSIPGAAMQRLLARFAGAGIAGGAVYDAAIAETARRADLALCSLDVRAAETYAAIGVEVVWIGLNS